MAKFLEDAWRFLLLNRRIVDEAPLQLYHSALVFAPTRSIIRGLFESDSPSYFETLPKVLSSWAGEIQQLEGHEDSVSTVAFSPCGTLIASGSNDCTVRLWAASSGVEMQKLEGHEHDILAVGFISMASRLEWNSSGRTFKLRSVKEDGPKADVDTVNRAVTEGSFPTERNAASYDELQNLEYHRISATDRSTGYDMYLASGSDDNTVRVWNILTGEQVHMVKGPDKDVAAMAFSPAGLFALSLRGCEVQIYDVWTGERMYGLGFSCLRESCLAFSPNGNVLASTAQSMIREGATGERSTMRVWHSYIGDAMFFRNTDEYRSADTALVLSDYGLVAALSCDDDVRLWNALTGEDVHHFQAEDPLHAVTLSPDGSILVTASSASITLWNTSTYKEVRRYLGPRTYVADMCFSPDSSVLVSADDMGLVRLWDTSIRERPSIIEHTSFREHTFSEKIEIPATSTNVAFTEDGSLLAAGSSDGTIRLWKPPMYEKAVTLIGHQDSVWRVALSTDNSMLATTSADDTIRLWDISTGKSY